MSVRSAQVVSSCLNHHLSLTEFLRSVSGVSVSSLIDLIVQTSCLLKVHLVLGQQN